MSRKNASRRRRTFFAQKQCPDKRKPAAGAYIFFTQINVHINNPPQAPLFFHQDTNVLTKESRPLAPLFSSHKQCPHQKTCRRRRLFTQKQGPNKKRREHPAASAAYVFAHHGSSVRVARPGRAHGSRAQVARGSRVGLAWVVRGPHAVRARMARGSRRCGHAHARTSAGRGGERKEQGGEGRDRRRRPVSLRESLDRTPPFRSVPPQS